MVQDDLQEAHLRSSSEIPLARDIFRFERAATPTPRDAVAAVDAPIARACVDSESFLAFSLIRRCFSSSLAKIGTRSSGTLRHTTPSLARASEIEKERLRPSLPPFDIHGQCSPPKKPSLPQQCCTDMTSLCDSVRLRTVLASHFGRDRTL